MESSRTRIVIGPDARWVLTPRGERIDLGRYGPARRLFLALVVARVEDAGRAFAAEALLDVAWPGEKMLHTAGLLRVYSAVRRLRKLGLEQVLMTRDDGYLLDPEADVELVTARGTRAA